MENVEVLQRNKVVDATRDKWAEYFSPNDLDCKTATCRLNGCYSCHQSRFARDPVGENFAIGMMIHSSHGLWVPSK